MKAHCISLMFALLLLVLAGSPAAAQTQQQSPSFVDKVEVTDGVVTFHPKEGRYQDFTMTVAGPDEFWLERSFSGRDMPSLRIKTEKGLTLPDGTYTIEVRARPEISDKQRAALEEVRQKGDRYQMHKLMKEIGFNPSAMAHAINLGVAKGAFMNPDMEEGTPRKDMGALDNTLDIQSVQLTGRRWDAAFLPNQAGGYAAADATNAAVQNAALTAETTPPPFAQPAARQPASWYEASFQNTTEDGTLVTYQGYLRPIALDGAGKLFQAYFQTVDGTTRGVWHEGYFRAEGDSYRFLNHTEMTQAANPTPLFDYVAQDQAPTGALDATLPDFVINDDLIVDGSACIGFDCVNGEVFSFDTIRIKENNLRIKADDTSVVPSFPDNDWQLVFNESANGGAEKFSVEDVSGGRTPFTIEANARSHSLYVDDGGRIGNRTSTPSVEIHTIDGDTPTLRLQQDGSSGFEPQTWDVAGNETNFFVRDVTNGSALPLRIRPGAPSNAFFVDVDGDIGLGTSSPSTLNSGADASLHIRRTDGEASLLIEEASGTTANNRVQLEVRNNGGAAMNFNNTSNAVVWSFLTSGANNFQISKIGAANGLISFAANTGDLTIPGTLIAGAKPFRIDHPLDPENKYLYHVAIESPDMMNVYNGNVVLNASGEAEVQLPAYFEKLNREFRYQLTCIGGFAPVYVAEKISGNRFRIAGGTAGMEVSWQVTGVRQDPWAEQNRIQVEVDKPAELQGYYMHPDAYNQPDARSAILRAQEVQGQTVKKQ